MTGGGLPDDRDLAGRFARLRREQREAAAPFAAIAARPGRRRGRASRFGGIVVATAAAVVFVTLVIRGDVAPSRERTRSATIDLRSAGWPGPTDFLLNVPGDWLLRDIPRIARPLSIRIDNFTDRRISS